MGENKPMVRVSRFKDDELAHFGILGQKWGVRRYQNKDGSLTPAGKDRYYEGTKNKISDEKLIKTSYKRRKTQSVLNRLDQEAAQNMGDAERYAQKALRTKNERKKNKYISKGRAYMENAKDIESVEWKLVGHAIERGYDVQMKNVSRASINKGASYAGAVLFGVPGAVAMTVATTRYVPSTLFKVKQTKDGKGTATHVVKV